MIPAIGTGSKLPISTPIVGSSSPTQQAAAEVFGHESDQKSTVHQVQSSMPASSSSLSARPIEVDLSALKKRNLPLSQAQKKRIFAIRDEDCVIHTLNPIPSFEAFTEHVSCRNVVYILTPTYEKAMEMVVAYHFAQQIIEKYQLTRCFVPSIQIERLTKSSGHQYGLVFFEKSQVVYKPLSCKEISEREFAQFEDSPAIKAKWIELFRQAADFVFLTGYDPSWQSINYKDDQLGFILPFNVSNRGNNSSVNLPRLAQMAPVEAMDLIVEAPLRQESPHEFKGKFEEWEKQERAEELLFNQMYRKWHQEKGIETGNQIDESLFSSDSIEGKIIHKCIMEIIFKELDKRYEDCLIAQRTVRLPLEEYLANKRDVEIALSKVMHEGLIFDWTVKENGAPEQKGLYIYC